MLRVSIGRPDGPSDEEEARPAMAMAQPQQSPKIMSMAIRDPHRGLYQVAFNDGVSGVRVDVPFEEASSVREARIKAEHTLQYQEWLRQKRLREHRIRQL